MKALELAAEHLATLKSDATPDDADVTTDAETLLLRLKDAGADIGNIMEALLLASDEADNDAEAIKQRRDLLKLRQDRRLRMKEACRNSALAIMAEFPELFRPKAKSKSLAAFYSPLVDARVQRGPDGVRIIDADKLMEQERFVTRSLNHAAVKEAVVKDGEVLDGAEFSNGAPFLVVRTS
jgi:hypothetical protein